MIFVVALLCAVEFAFFVLITVLFIRSSRSTDIFHRLRRHVADDSSRFKQTEDILQRTYKFIKRTSKPLDKFEFSKTLEFKLRQAGIPLFGSEFIVIAIIGAVLGTILIYIITLNVTIAPLAGLMIPILMWLWVVILVNRRRKAFTEQLGDCLTTVANALRAGYSFQQAMSPRKWSRQ